MRSKAWESTGGLGIDGRLGNRRESWESTGGLGTDGRPGNQGEACRLFGFSKGAIGLTQLGPPGNGPTVNLYNTIRKKPTRPRRG